MYTAQRMTRPLSRNFSKNSAAYGFLAPYILFYVIFVLIPVFWSFWLTLRKGGLLSGTTFIGFNNFNKVWENEIFMRALRNTAYYTILVVPLAMISSLILALLIDKMKTVWQNVVKSALFLPMVSSVVSLSIIWKAIFIPGKDGPLNTLVGLFGIPPQNWLGNPRLVIPSIVGFEIWRGYGFWVILFLAGLDAIPDDLYKAARVDGANAWHRLTRITLPLLRPTFLFLLVMGIIWNFQIFDAVYMLTAGGPANSSATVVWYVYRNAFHFENLGFAATMGVFLLFIILILTVIQLKYMPSEID
jgi:ABC-type sugar transport system permease subunit